MMAVPSATSFARECTKSGANGRQEELGKDYVQRREANLVDAKEKFEQSLRKSQSALAQWCQH